MDCRTYTGDMTVGINSQLKVTIPNNQLFFNERYIAPNGTVTSWAHIKQIPIVRIQPGDGMMPRLGGMFFSSAVLTTNHDKGEFSIAAASTKPAAQKLIAIDSANNCTGPVESKTTTTGNSGSEPGSNNNGNNTGNNGSIPGYVETVDKGLSVGAIVGIVIAGVAVIAAIAFFLWRRRRAAAAAALPKAYEVEAPGYQSAPPVEKYAYHVAEVSDANQAHEMFHHDPRYAPVELDSGMARPNDVPGAAPAPTNGVATRT